MKTRREFLKLGAVSLIGATGASSLVAVERPSESTPNDVRSEWCGIAARLASPVLKAASNRELKARMPVESATGATDRQHFSHLEAVSRLLTGLAPWIELGSDGTPEGAERTGIAVLARKVLDSISDPDSPDFLNFHDGRQPLVDAAFLAQALMRAPTELWQKLESRVKANLVAALLSTRPISAGENNWKLFATTIEVFLQRAGARRDDIRLFEGLEKHARWYLGDGIYGDGSEFHWDYYNSFVIQPMLVEALEAVGKESPQLSAYHQDAVSRLGRFAAIQERLIAPDGSYPAIGRSITYRCGAFQALAFAAWRGMLPISLTPSQVRAVLTAVIRRTLNAPGTFDEQGWLRIGLSGHQPSLGESYISTGSLYLCSTALLPLGLPSTHPFWSSPDVRGTWEKAWAGENLPADHALNGKA